MFQFILLEHSLDYVLSVFLSVSSGRNFTISEISQSKILHNELSVFVDTDSSAISLCMVLLSKLLIPHLFLK